MRNINEKPLDTVIQIEVTNKCNRSCCNCVRLCGHYVPEKIFYVDMNKLVGYLHALRDFHGWVGFIGGEPTLHPDFKEICYLVKSYRRKEEAAIFTNGLTKTYKDNEELIRDTFGLLNYNDHTTNITHTPVLAASDEYVESVEEREKYYDDCWVQNTWSATITPKGAYFCEIAAMFAWLYDGPNGWDPMDENWWRKLVPEYRSQIDWACHQCGAALPMIPRSSKDSTDDVSPKQLEKLIAVKSPKVLAGKYEVYDRGFILGQKRTRDWYWNR